MPGGVLGFGYGFGFGFCLSPVRLPDRPSVRPSVGRSVCVSVRACVFGCLGLALMEASGNVVVLEGCRVPWVRAGLGFWVFLS